jgi:hypothetical protein
MRGREGENMPSALLTWVGLCGRVPASEVIRTLAKEQQKSLTTPP